MSSLSNKSSYKCVAYKSTADYKLLNLESHISKNYIEGLDFNILT